MAQATLDTELHSPGRMRRDLHMLGLAAVLVQAALCAPVLVCVQLLAPADALRTSMLVGLQLLLYLLLWVSCVRLFDARVLPLYRALSRMRCAGASTCPPAEQIPPSQAAVRDAFASWRLGWWAALGGCSVPLVGQSGVIISDAGRWAPTAFAGLAFAAASILATLAATELWERATWNWRRHVQPEHIPLQVRHTLARRLAGTVCAALAWMTGLGLLVAAPGAGSLVVASKFGVAALFAMIAAATTGAHLLGRRHSRDLRALSERVRTSGGPAPAPAFLWTREVRSLGRASTRLAERFARLASQQGAAQLAVEQAQRVKARFVASMSHDLRGPLNSILGFAELMALGTDGPLNAKQRENVVMIQRSTEDLLRLLHDMLDWVRLEAGRVDLQLEWTPSVEILTEAVRQGREMTSRRHLTIDAELQPGLPPLYVDSERIVQAIMGLFGHAVRAMEAGTIRLRARVAHGPPGPVSQVRVDVVDASAGIRPEDRQRIFEAFREIAEPSGRRIGGLGLGLAVARGLVQAHGGDAWCESRPGGTTLTVALPIRERTRSAARVRVHRARQ